MLFTNWFVGWLCLSFLSIGRIIIIMELWNYYGTQINLLGIYRSGALTS